MIHLRFDPKAQLIRLRAELRCAVQRDAVLVLDTGASLTVLSPRLTDTLGAPAVGADSTAQILTAGGVAAAHRVHLASITLYGERLGPFQVLSAPLPPQIRAAGILGLDVLRHFNVTLDFEHGLLTLERIHPFQLCEPGVAYHASATSVSRPAVAA